MATRAHRRRIVSPQSSPMHGRPAWSAVAPCPRGLGHGVGDRHATRRPGCAPEGLWASERPNRARPFTLWRSWGACAARPTTIWVMLLREAYCSTVCSRSSALRVTTAPPSCSASFRAAAVRSAAHPCWGVTVGALDVEHRPGRVHHQVGQPPPRAHHGAAVTARLRSAPGCARPPPRGPRCPGRASGRPAYRPRVWAARRSAISRSAVRFSGLKKRSEARRAVSGT